jgi:ATP-dependent Clp protease protease subunit
MNGPPPPCQPQQDLYLIFCGSIDAVATQKIATALSNAAAQNAKSIHLVMQTAGGSVADGIFLYNLFRASPIDLTLYNIGLIASAGVIAYLGAHHRKTSALAIFMTHRTTAPSLPAHPSQSRGGIMHSIYLDDARTETILKAHLKLSEDVWANLWRHDLHWSANDAVSVGVADAVAEFAPPFGASILTL